MADPISFPNPLAGFGGEGSFGLSSFATILLIFFIAIVILALVGWFIYWRFVKRAYWINIEVSRMIGGTPQRVAIYSAKEVAFGMAGDKLWRVASAGMWKFKAVKWLSVGKKQSAPRMWKYWIREDGEWINYVDANLDEISKQMKVRFVNEDMRLQRLATERLLEQRLMDKTFWEKWGTTVMMIIVFLVIAVCMVVMFYQFSKLLDKFGEVAGVNLETSKILYKVFGERFISDATNMTGGTSGLVPV